ncbi:AAA family ATPase [Thermopolyspora sp. NPDC052614]|uniref:AAA family ATPase n=1 Tax=Thermopolyspora sp. NPDC052614 TaxID=3155682 RepID=UPI003413D2B1
MPPVERHKFFDVHRFPGAAGEFTDGWRAVIVPEHIKTTLLRYASTLRRLEKVPPTALALRRAVLLYGPPGCGKTSLARGLPAVWGEAERETTGFVHINTHALFSGIRGEGQKNVLAAFDRIAELASSGLPLFVLVDEVETLASNRADINMEANPLDALYQVTAFLESLDRCARESPNVILVFTTNIPRLIDRAVRERADFVLEIPLPSREHRSLILADAVRKMAIAFDVSDLLAEAEDGGSEEWSRVLDATEGLSGRALRHLLVIAATLAGGGSVVRSAHLREAVEQVALAEAELERSGGMYVESYQESYREKGTAK